MFISARAIQLLIAVFSLALNNSIGFAGGFMVPHQTARGVGISNALTASVSDASAVYYNPAALSEIDGNNLLVSGSYINVVSRVENDGRKVVNKHEDNLYKSRCDLTVVG